MHFCWSASAETAQQLLGKMRLYLVYILSCYWGGRFEEQRKAEAAARAGRVSCRFAAYVSRPRRSQRNVRCVCARVSVWTCNVSMQGAGAVVGRTGRRSHGRPADLPCPFTARTSPLYVRQTLYSASPILLSFYNKKKNCATNAFR